MIEVPEDIDVVFDEAEQRRFWSFVVKGPSCWLFSPSLKGAYGQFRIGPKTYRAHRLLWEFINGKLPREIEVMHKCDVPRCVNPSHLMAGTHSENMQDMVMKGRHPYRYGEAHHKAKLTEKAVRYIRRIYAFRSKNNMVALACRFGVTRHTILKVLSREYWPHV